MIDMTSWLQCYQDAVLDSGGLAHAEHSTSIYMLLPKP